MRQTGGLVQNRYCIDPVTPSGRARDRFPQEDSAGAFHERCKLDSWNVDEVSQVGSAKKKVLPALGVLSAQIRPPCASRMHLEI